MEEIKQVSLQTNDEISIKKLLQQLQDWLRYFWSKKFIIVIIGLSGGLAGLIFSFLIKPRFVAELTFVLEENKGSSSLAAYAGLASQFGFDIGGGSSGAFTGDNILYFLKSRMMMEKTLLHPVIVDGRPITLAELYINFNNFREDWKTDSLLGRLNYPVNLPRSQFSRLQDSMLNIFQKNLVQDNIEISKPDKALNFISVKCTSINELFSKKFGETLVKEAADFYITTKTTNSTRNIAKLQATADSIERLLNRKAYSIAATKDMNVNPIRQMASVETELETRNNIVLQTIYAEVIKNLEINKMSMAQETPFIQIIDTPILPLERIQLRKLKGIIIGGIVAGFMSIFVLTLIRLYDIIINS